uniref:28S ribosomal protein S31, mitochondrial n=1 Tax=Mesocestoides corti TaxID=53468 RepID=A0A5K3EJQ7_MESCO
MLITFSRLLHPLRSPRLIATRILSSFGKKPRIPPRKTKAVTKDRASLLSNPPIAPSTSQLLEDFLTPPGRSKSQENAEDKKDYLEKSARPRITRKKPLNDDTTPAPRDISQAQSQDVIKSVDLLRDFLNAEVQPPKRSARAHARTIHGPSRVRRTEMLPPPAKLDLFDQETFSNLCT